MRDPIRERDLEDRGVHAPSIDVDDKGLAAITMRRDDLDRLLEVSARGEAYDNGFAKGQRAGYRAGWDACSSKGAAA